MASITNADLVWYEGLDSWRPLGEVFTQAVPPAIPVVNISNSEITNSASYPGFGLRCLAFLLDLVAIYVALIPGALILGLTVRVMGIRDRVILEAAWKILVVVVGWLYSAAMESSAKQATLGKLAFGLRVTDMNGRRISFGRATGARVCWASDLFSAAELLRQHNGCEFEGVSAFLYICAVDALVREKPRKPHGPTTKRMLSMALQARGNRKEEARQLASKLWKLRNAGVHLGVTDRLDAQFTVMAENSLISAKTMEKVNEQLRKQQIAETITMIDHYSFPRNADLFFVARHAAAEAISKKVTEAIDKL